MSMEAILAEALKELELVPDKDSRGWYAVGPDGIHHRSLRDAALDSLGLCGCSGESVDYVIGLLRELRSDPPPFWTDGPREFFLNMMDHLRIAEHGTSVRGSWLTERGRAVLFLLEHGDHPQDEKDGG